MPPKKVIFDHILLTPTDRNLIRKACNFSSKVFTHLSLIKYGVSEDTKVSIIFSLERGLEGNTDLGDDNVKYVEILITDIPLLPSVKTVKIFFIIFY